MKLDFEPLKQVLLLLYTLHFYSISAVEIADKVCYDLKSSQSEKDPAEIEIKIYANKTGIEKAEYRLFDVKGTFLFETDDDITKEPYPIIKFLYEKAKKYIKSEISLQKEINEWNAILSIDRLLKASDHLKDDDIGKELSPGE